MGVVRVVVVRVVGGAVGNVKRGSRWLLMMDIYIYIVKDTLVILR